MLGWRVECELIWDVVDAAVNYARVDAGREVPHYRAEWRTR